MNDTLMIRTNNQLIARIIIKASYKVINMMSFNHMGCVFFSNQLATYLASVPIKLFQVVTDASIQLSNLCNLCPFFDACIRISYFNVALFFKCSLVKSEEIFPCNTEIIFNDWFKDVRVIVVV